MSVRVWKGCFMVYTLGHENIGPNVVFEALELYIPSGLARRQREASWRQRGQTEASSRAQILARYTETYPLPTPLGPPKLRLFGGKTYICK